MYVYETADIIIEFAYLSNSFRQSDTAFDSKVYLDAVPLTQDEFLSIFYNTCGLDFGICPSLYHSFPLSFLNKKYTTSNNIPVSYSLYDQVLHAYSVKCNDALEITGIPNHVKIHLQKELFKVNTIVNHYIYQSAFSFEEIITGLIHSGKIEISTTNTMDDSVKVIFQLEYVYVSTLDTAISVVFSYLVPLCGYISKKELVTPRREDSGMVLEGEDADDDAYENMSDITTSDYDG